MVRKTLSPTFGGGAATFPPMIPRQCISPDCLGNVNLPRAKNLPQFSVVCLTSPFGLTIRLTNKLGAHKSEGKLGFFAQVYTNFTRVYHIGFYV